MLVRKKKIKSRARRSHDVIERRREVPITTLSRRAAVAGALSLAALFGSPAHAQDAFKIGLILPMTGGQASTGKQIDNAIKLYMQQKGDTVAGKKIEMIVNDKVNVIAGFGVTPAALAAAPLATQGKVPEIVMAAGTSIITERSPYIVRTSF